MKKTHTDTEKTEKPTILPKRCVNRLSGGCWQDVPSVLSDWSLITMSILITLFIWSFDGQHLTLPGVSSRFDLRPIKTRHFKRTIQQGDVCYAHGGRCRQDVLL